MNRRIFALMTALLVPAATATVHAGLKTDTENEMHKIEGKTKSSQQKAEQKTNSVTNSGKNAAKKGVQKTDETVNSAGKKVKSGVDQITK